MIARRRPAPFASALTKSGLDVALERFLTKGRDIGCRRTATAPLDHCVHPGGSPSEDGLDRAIGKVLDPAVQSETPSSAQGPAPVPHTLNPSFDADAHTLSLIQ